MRACVMCGAMGEPMVMMKPEKPSTHLTVNAHWRDVGPVCQKHAKLLDPALNKFLDKEIRAWEQERNSLVFSDAGIWKVIPLPDEGSPPLDAKGRPVVPVADAPPPQSPIEGPWVVPVAEGVVQPVVLTPPPIVTDEDLDNQAAARERMAHARKFKGKKEAGETDAA